MTSEGQDDSIRWQSRPAYHHLHDDSSHAAEVVRAASSSKSTLPTMLNLPLPTHRPVWVAGTKNMSREKKPGWHFPGANEEKPKSTSRDVIWFLAGCRAMSQVVLKDESREEDNFPRVNSTTGPSGYHPENSRGVEKTKKTDAANDTATVLPCLLTKREFKQNQTCHSTKAISESGAGKI